MPVEVRECKLSAMSSGGATTGTTGGGRTIDDSIEAAIARFESEVAPSSIDGVGTRPTGPNRCAVIINYTA